MSFLWSTHCSLIVAELERGHLVYIAYITGYLPTMDLSHSGEFHADGVRECYGLLADKDPSLVADCADEGFTHIATSAGSHATFQCKKGDRESTLRLEEGQGGMVFEVGKRDPRRIPVVLRSASTGAGFMQTDP